jgi:hypothetical protein
MLVLLTGSMCLSSTLILVTLLVALSLNMLRVARFHMAAASAAAATFLKNFFRCSQFKACPETTNSLRQLEQRQPLVVPAALAT